MKTLQTIIATMVRPCVAGNRNHPSTSMDSINAPGQEGRLILRSFSFLDYITYDN